MQNTISVLDLIIKLILTAMLTLNTKIEHTDQIDGELVLPYEMREKSRFRAMIISGEEVAVFTQRGTVLRHGDLLRGDDHHHPNLLAPAPLRQRIHRPAQIESGKK